MEIDISIKENRNLCGHNLWSGTDYLGVVSSEKNNNSQFACTQGWNVLESSKEWSSNFEKSIKQTLLPSNYTAFLIENINLNTTYTASVTIHSNTRGTVYFIARDQPNQHNNIIKSVPFTTTNHTPITITIHNTEFTGTETQLQIRVVNEEEGTIYSDDWSLTYS